VRSDQLVTVFSAAIFVFVGVDCNHLRYVLGLEVIVRCLFGDVPGALLIILNSFDWNVWRILVLDGLLHPHSSIQYVQMVAVLPCIRSVCCLGIAVNVRLLAGSCFDTKMELKEVG